MPEEEQERRIQAAEDRLQSATPNRMTKTQTYSILPVSQATFQEIMTKLQDAGYDGQIHARQGDRLTLDTIDMHGLALQVEISEPTNEPLPAPEPID